VTKKQEKKEENQFNVDESISNTQKELMETLNKSRLPMSVILMIVENLYLSIKLQYGGAK